MTKKRQPQFLITFTNAELKYFEKIKEVAKTEAEARDDETWSNAKTAKRILIHHLKGKCALPVAKPIEK